MIDYLKTTYGDAWENYLKQWEANTEFWNMLMDAEGGDVLLTNFGTYSFAGEGQDILNGIFLSDELGNPINKEGCECQNYTLGEFAMGHTMSFIQEYPLVWYANIRWIGPKKGITGTIYVNPNYIVADAVYNPWQSVGADLSFGLGSLASSFAASAAGLPLLTQVLLGTGETMIGVGTPPSRVFRMTSSDTYLMFFANTEIPGQVNVNGAQLINPRIWAEYYMIFSNNIYLTPR